MFLESEETGKHEGNPCRHEETCRTLQGQEPELRIELGIIKLLGGNGTCFTLSFSSSTDYTVASLYVIFPSPLLYVCLC